MSVFLGGKWRELQDDNEALQQQLRLAETETASFTDKIHLLQKERQSMQGRIGRLEEAETTLRASGGAVRPFLVPRLAGVL